MEISVLVTIRQNLERFSQANQRIAHHVLNNPGLVIEQTIAEMARDTQVSEATVVRFCREIGFKGFSDFKLRIARDLGTMGTSEYQIERGGAKPGDSSLTVVQKAITSHMDDLDYMLKTLDTAAFEQGVQLLSQAEKIAFFSIASSYTAAFDASWHFSNIGKIAFAKQDASSQLLLSQMLSVNDVAVGVSISGQSKTTVQCIRLAKEQGIPTIGITQNSKSELAQTADCVILTHRREQGVHDLATSSKVLQVAVLDALCMAVTAADWSQSKQHLDRNLKLIQMNQF